MYVLTDGERFIYRNHQNKFVPTNSECMAEQFTKKQAEGILKNSLPKALQKIFRMKREEETEKFVKPPDEEMIHENSVKASESTNLQFWLDKVSTLNGLAEDAKNRHDELVNELKHIEKELVDIRHYIEFTRLNAAQGFKAYQMERDRLVHRRKIKNEILVVRTILNKNIGQVASSEVERTIIGLGRRKYEPRVLRELFDL